MPSFPLTSPEHSGGAVVLPQPPALSAAMDAVVRVEALLQGKRLALGSGFCIRKWPATLITAQHVVAGADAVRIHARSGNQVITFGVVAMAHAGGVDGVALLCPSGALKVNDPFLLRDPQEEPELDLEPDHHLLQPEPEASLEVVVLGYPATAGLAHGAVAVETHAGFRRPWLKLGAFGQGGMSGGPVFLKGTSPREVVGVYVGPRNVGGVFAFATDKPHFNEQMTAAATLRAALMGAPV